MYADTDRCRRQDLVTVDQKRLLELLEQIVDQSFQLFVAVERIKDQKKLIAADTTGKIAWPDMSGNPLRHLEQQRVTDRVRVIVVDVLEVIDVEKCQRKTAAPFAACQHLPNLFGKQCAVRQAGQFVDIGALRQFEFGLFAIGEVECGRHQQRPVQDANRAVRNQKRALAGQARTGNDALLHGDVVRRLRRLLVHTGCGQRRGRRNAGARPFG